MTLYIVAHVFSTIATATGTRKIPAREQRCWRSRCWRASVAAAAEVAGWSGWPCAAINVDLASATRGQDTKSFPPAVVASRRVCGRVVRSVDSTRTATRRQRVEMCRCFGFASARLSERCCCRGLSALRQDSALLKLSLGGERNLRIRLNLSLTELIIIIIIIINTLQCGRCLGYLHPHNPRGRSVAVPDLF